MSVASKRDAITAALDLAEDLGSRKVDPTELDRELVDICRQLFGTVAGSDDPLWSLHLDVARQVLAAGGLSLDEVAEWEAVLRRRAQGDQTQPNPPDIPADDVSAASGPHSPETSEVET